MPTLIITEKTSQARDLRAALGDRFGHILPAEGHLLRLAEPHEVNADWRQWACVLLKPSGLYPTKAAAEGGKPAKLRAIAAALERCDRVILATDCDREGQLIGQEILEHLRFAGRVERALFTAQDPKSLRQAFDKLKPNHELRPLYEAAVARQQADQIFNLSLTRTATRMLVARGTKGVIGIGRVKSPTLAILCLREIEIRDFKVEDYFEIVATAKVEDGTFLMRHAPPARARITDRAVADTIAQAAASHTGPLDVVVEERRQAPPRLYDLPSLQKTCGQRWGWAADKTLSVAQELYDGDGKKVITYPRAEARHLAENQIADVPAIVAAMLRLRGFAHLTIDPPVIRRGKAGVFSDKALEGVSHHAIVPNVNVMEDLESRIARLTDDEKRLFALICRAYLASVMPDYEYRQTVVSMQIPFVLPPPAAGSPPGELPRANQKAEFRAVGRIPLKLGWKAAFGSAEPEPDKSKHGKDTDEDGDKDQELPQLTNGQSARLHRSKVQAKKTQPPPRYGEGTLVDAMQNAWRFVSDEALRERLKEAKGIGTPATRAEIIKGLRRQNLIMASGKHVVPTPAGLQLFEVLRAAAPQIVDPGTTAMWEMRLDDVVTGKADFRAVIDEIANEAARVIGVLRRHNGPGVDLTKPASARRARSEPDGDAQRARVGEARPKRRRTETGKASGAASRRNDGARHPQPAETRAHDDGRSAGSKPPTERMVAFAQRLARDRKAELPPGYDKDFDVCRRFLDRHAS